jgi:GTP:adenosylcobinamide-phosphate guanylyltransferase
MANTQDTAKIDSKLPAIILAGSPPDPAIEAAYSVPNRAAVPIAGKMMLEYIVDALRGASGISEIRLIGDLQCPGITETVTPPGTLIENLIAGMRASCPGGKDSHVLVATSDIPMLTSEAVDDFLRRCGDFSADFYYPVIAKSDAETQFPGMRRTYARLAEGTFTGGNIVVMRAGFVLENAETIRSVFGARKSVMRLAGLIGLPILFRAIMAQYISPRALDLKAIEQTVGRLLHATVKALPTSYAGIGADADNVEQIEAFRRILVEKVS